MDVVFAVRKEETKNTPPKKRRGGRWETSPGLTNWPDYALVTYYAKNYGAEQVKRAIHLHAWHDTGTPLALSIVAVLRVHGAFAAFGGLES